MMRRAMAIAIILAGLAAAAGDALALSPHVREGWVLGLSYGGARGEAEAPDGTSGGTEDGVSPQIRFGHMLGSHLSLGASYAGWMYETGTQPIKHRYALQAIMLAGTWYPGRADSGLGGLYLRGGVGLGWANATDIEMVEGEEQGHGDRTTESGLGLELNLGYEFRLVRNMAAGIGIGYNHLDIGGDLYEKADFFPVTLNLGWYWD
ncbi:MAG TPA: outer membrane beta-barrel protein [Candidatus Krumholzibacteria bacterium]|nr:outer membrane beta-barrel protein [Candidatus Krumholzibacteria bacterium]